MYETITRRRGQQKPSRFRLRVLQVENLAVVRLNHTNGLGTKRATRAHRRREIVDADVAIAIASR